MSNFDSFEEAGISIGEIRATGGGSRSPYWAQLKADMTGRRVTVVHHSEASALGSAVCAAAALGKFGSIVEAAGCLVKLGKTYEPDKDKHEIYRTGLERYRDLYRSVEQYRSTGER
jgi:xylulokinase